MPVKRLEAPFTMILLEHPFTEDESLDEICHSCTCKPSHAMRILAEIRKFESAVNRDKHPAEKIEGGFASALIWRWDDGGLDWQITADTQFLLRLAQFGKDSYKLSEDRRERRNQNPQGMR